jgi:uncharacterized protein (DUF2267 family)
MSQTGLSVFDTTIQTTHHWLNELMAELGWDDRHRAYQALRAVLHALRDHLTVDEVVALGAQLPLLVRGCYYEGWHPADKPLPQRKRDAFLASLQSVFHNAPAARVEEVARAVFRVLAKHVTTGAIEDVKHLLPRDIRRLWP